MGLLKVNVLEKGMTSDMELSIQLTISLRSIGIRHEAGRSSMVI